jgi:regulatory protein
MDKLREQVGTFEAPIGSVQLPQTGVRYDKRGNPKPLQSGQDEHPEPGERAPRAKRRPEPELEFTTDLFAADPAERKVLTACHKVLSGTQVTTEQLRRKLVKAGFEPHDVELGIDKCTAAGLLDDVFYASQWVESRVRRGHGPARIRQDLAQRGIDRALVDAALAEHADPDSLAEAAIGAARTKFARVDLEDRTARAKALRWLLGRGYSSSHADAALRVVRQEQADDRS